MSSIASSSTAVRTKSLRKAHSMPHIPLLRISRVEAERRFNNGGDYEEQMAGCSAAGGF